MKLQKIDVSKFDEGEKEFNYEETYNRCLVDLSEELKKPPTAMGIGYNEYKGKEYLNNTFTYGEFSAIVAGSKNKKTFKKSALIAAYIGGGSTNFFPNLVSCRQGDKHILDFDTEQGDFYAQRAFRRVADMVGTTYEHYYPFGIEGLEPAERVEFIDKVLKDPRHRGKVGWMSIDGLLDLLDNENDIAESSNVLKHLMRWKKESFMHINIIIHKNSTSNKATGHLGSKIQRKCETIILLEDTDQDPDNRNSPIKVQQTYSRGASFDTYYFDLDDETLPKECECDNDNNWK